MMSHLVVHYILEYFLSAHRKLIQTCILDPLYFFLHLFHLTIQWFFAIERSLSEFAIIVAAIIILSHFATAITLILPDLAKSAASATTVTAAGSCIAVNTCAKPHQLTQPHHIKRGGGNTFNQK